jgi:hypothetical protein
MATLAYHIFKKQVSYDGGETWQDVVPLETVKMPVTGVTCEVPWTSRMVYKRYQDKCVDPCYAGEATGCTHVYSGCDLTYDVTEYYVNLSKGSTLSSGDTGVIINDGDIDNDSSTIALENCTLVINSGLTTIDDDAFPWNHVIPTSLGGRIDTIDFTNATDLTKIGKKAFWYKLNRNMRYGKPLVRELTFPNSLATIDDEAFEGSTLEHIYFGANSSINTIGDEAFKTIPGITVHFSGATPPSNVSDYAFGNYPKFVIIVPDQYLSTYRNVMSGISSNIISDTHLGNTGKCQYGSLEDSGSTITTIPCDSTSALTSADGTICSWMKIGDCVETIGNGFMYNTYQDVYDINDKHLLYLDLGSSVKYIGDEAFKNQQRLEKITFPNSLRTIGASAFTNCEMLTDINIPSGVTSIGDYAFANIYNLTGLTVGGGSIGVGAFACRVGNYWDVARIKSLNLEGVTSIGASAFTYTELEIQDIIIPDSVTSIGEYAFDCNRPGYCCLVTGVTVGSGVTSISGAAFPDSVVEVTINAVTPPTIYGYPFRTTALQKIYVPCDSYSSYKSQWSNYSQYIFRKPECPQEPIKVEMLYSNGQYYYVECNDSTILTGAETKPSGYESSAMTSADIGNCVTELEWHGSYGGTFQNCYSLTSVTIPNSVITIGQDAFGTCTGLTSVNIPDSVTTIGIASFRYCSGMTSVTIGSGVTRIFYDAFSRCYSLNSITITATTPPSLGSSALQYTNNCPIYVPSGSVNVYKSASVWSNYASRIQAIP